MRKRQPKIIKFFLNPSKSGGTEAHQKASIARMERALDKKLPGVFKIERFDKSYRLSVDPDKLPPRWDEETARFKWAVLASILAGYSISHIVHTFFG